MNPIRRIAQEEVKALGEIVTSDITQLYDSSIKHALATIDIYERLEALENKGKPKKVAKKKK
jgi:hypothetical protein